MASSAETIAELLQKTELLSQRQIEFGSELRSLRQQLLTLQQSASLDTLPTATISPVVPPANTVSLLPVPEEPEGAAAPSVAPVEAAIPVTPPPIPPVATRRLNPVQPARRDQSALEKFLGENLINKIGIAVLVIGVAIGAKYSIEHELISPLTRIVLGYLVGAGLCAVGLKLKAKYEAYSAVLVSGAIAIMYFITFAAYSFYSLIPQGLAFALMVGFTGFIVTAAVHYNRQVVALIGLVGAYAVPFLLSEGSGQVVILFSYVFIINVGILILAFKRSWNILYYSAFALTWLLFGSWFGTQYNRDTQFGLAFTFLLLFFAQFYAIFLAYKMVRGEALRIADVALLLLNAFIFYGMGYSMLAEGKTGSQLLGLFTLANAVLHFGVAVLLYRRQGADKKLFYLISALVLTFVTIAAPVQLDGHWVTLLWTAEAAILFWLGRTKGIAIYEMLSYPLMVLATGSLLQDWNPAYNPGYIGQLEWARTPLFNIDFATSLLFLGAFAGIYKLHRNKDYPSVLDKQPEYKKMVNVALPAVLLFVSYFAFRNEIGGYFESRYLSTAIKTGGKSEDAAVYYNNNISSYKGLWLINYTLLYGAVLTWLNLRKIQHRMLGRVNIGLLALGIVAFLTQGLLLLSDLRDTYLDTHAGATLVSAGGKEGFKVQEYFKPPASVLGLRYIGFAFMALALWALYKYSRKMFRDRKFQMGFDALLHISILWMASSELINILALAGNGDTYKLGLSILWGFYALLLIVLGIWKRKQYLRFGAMALFGITLLKLFFYDIAYLGTIAKTVVFVSLGILLLLISFLYNKYTSQIAAHEEPSEE